MPYPTRNCRQKPVVKDSCSTYQSSFMVFYDSQNKTYNFHMYTPLQVSSNSKIRNRKTVRQILHTVNHQKHWLCVFIMLAYLCKLEYQSVCDLLLSFSFGVENIMVCRNKKQDCPLETHVRTHVHFTSS